MQVNCPQILFSEHFLPKGKESFATNYFSVLCSNRRQYNGYAPTTFVGLELSLIPQVESVFVDEPVSRQKVLRVITVINDRNAEVRARIYEREQVIINSFPNLEFSFRVISRMNRQLSDVVERIGKLVYQR